MEEEQVLTGANDPGPATGGTNTGGGAGGATQAGGSDQLVVKVL